MIKKLETQDQYGNKIYRYTSSDIVLDLDTGHSVKQDIDLILAALGISGKESSTEVHIDAATLEGLSADKFVLAETYTNYTKAVADEIALKAPLDSPRFTGTPTAPSVDPLDSTEKIANTKYVDDAVSVLKEEVVNTLKNYAASQHSHAASDILSGEFSATNVRAKDGTDYSISRIRNAKLIGESEELPASLDNGSMLLVYEG